MATISERIGVIEERTHAILKAIEEMKDVHEWHLERCHNTMQPLIEENRKNSIFREVSVWILTSSGVIGFIGGLIWAGLKVGLKA